MKKITAIGLLVLLLHNMFGLTVAMLFFEDNYKVASLVDENDKWQIVKMHLPTLPYNNSNSWKDTDGQDGLIREGGDFYNVTEKRHENDTLFVTLKTNQSARDRFFELASMIQEITDQSSETTSSPLSKAIKLLSDLVKVYLPNTSMDWPLECIAVLNAVHLYSVPNQTLLHNEKQLHSPPPELV